MPAWGWQCGWGAHWSPPRAALRRGKDAHIGEQSLRALSFRVGGERTAGTRQQVTASNRKLPPLEAGVASTRPPAAERPLTASSTSAKMMLGHGSTEECTEARTAGGREPVPSGMSSGLQERYFPGKSTFSSPHWWGGLSCLVLLYVFANSTSHSQSYQAQHPRGASDSGVCRLNTQRLPQGYDYPWRGGQHTLGLEEQFKELISLIGNTKQTNQLLPAVKFRQASEFCNCSRPCFSAWYLFS